MPDGDRNHDRVAKHFNKAFKKACEGTLTSEDISQSLVQGLKLYGNAPIQAMSLFVNEVRDELGAVGCWRDANIMRCSQIAGGISATQMGNKRGLSLSLDSCREWLQESHENDLNLELSLFRTFIRRMYVADMVESLPLSVLHMDKDPQDVERLLERLDADIEFEINRIAAQLVKTRDVGRLRKPPVNHAQIDPHVDDLLNGFGEE